MSERTIDRRRFLAGTAALAAAVSFYPRRGRAETPALVETGFFAKDVADKKLPPIAERLPDNPLVVAMSGYKRIGTPGGDIRMLMQRPQDTRMMVVYSGTRLVGYNEKFEFEADILERFAVEDGRSFTLKLRKGHKWSDGKPFTTEDFRYYMEDIIGNKELNPIGPPPALIVDGKTAKMTIVDELTVQYSWDKIGRAHV